MTAVDEDKRPVTHYQYKSMIVWSRCEPNAHGLLHCHQVPAPRKPSTRPVRNEMPENLFAGYLSLRQLKKL